MSGHSKWSTIKRKKGAADAKRGNIFTKHAKNIALAARSGGDPAMNSSLYAAIESARKDNMPNNNIERAIKKGTGELKDGSEIVEVMYEGYGPEGIAVMVLCQTDNLNRTIAQIRHIFSKNGGNIGEKGCVAYMFSRKGVLLFEDIKDKESLEMAAIEAGCEDIDVSDEVVEIITPAENLQQVKKSLEESGFKPTDSELTFIPDNYLTLDQDKISRVEKFLEIMEDDDDVFKVYSNLGY